LPRRLPLEQPAPLEQPEHGATKGSGELAVPCAGHGTKAPSGRKPPSVAVRKPTPKAIAAARLLRELAED
jgi:hypothetical protein